MSPLQRHLALVAISVCATNAYGKGAVVKNVYVAPNGNEVRIDVELSRSVKPTIRMLRNPSRLIIDFPASLQHSTYLTVNRNGVSDFRAASDPENPSNTRIVVGIDSARPYGIQSIGNKYVLSILPHPVRGSNIADVVAPSRQAYPIPISHLPTANTSFASRTPDTELQVTHLPFDKLIEAPDETSSPVAPRRQFKVKYISGNNIYIDGGSNSGLRPGMQLEILAKPSSPTANGRVDLDTTYALAKVIGTATASAVSELGDGDRAVHVGDAAELVPDDAIVADRNAQILNASRIMQASDKDVNESSSADGDVRSRALLASRQKQPESGTHLAGRLAIDYSSITSTGSTPGTSLQRGISFQSDMTRILGSHWNLQGYWRARLNDHSQFREPTIEESLNKTYTMQLYYDNPESRWVGGVGRLYLPWAVSLDTIDGGYLGHKWPLGLTTGIFAGSTPDLNSWHYRPNQRIGGSFLNFQGGSYDRFHFSSTTGIGVNTIGWKVDRPFAFFENEASYKGVFSVYHSLIADTLRGVSTNGLRTPPGVSHSYFTAHFKPIPLVTFDLYHNYFRDVPTATTAIVGTGLVDQLLFQGLSGGAHLKPVRNISLYATAGASEKTGDSHRSLNLMYGGSWSEIARSGIRADFHYSKFDSNFGKGNYKVFSLSRQVTNHAFWNVQVGKQQLLSYFTTNRNSIYVDESLDINVGRKSYLQSGYTYVKGPTLNYRQVHFSWGFRFGGRSRPQSIEMGPAH